jgi:hypothetical protein
LDVRNSPRSLVSFGLDPQACWSGLAGRTAGCCSRDHHPGRIGPGAPPHLHHGPTDWAVRSRSGPVGAPPTPSAPLLPPAPPSALPPAAGVGAAGHYYTGIFKGKIKNFPAVQPRFFGALQCSTITFRVRRTEA